jgi:hypothetical protein
MTWTTTKPTVPGWYWWRPYRDADENLWRVYRVCAANASYVVATLGGEWAGPIPEPKEVA